MCLTARVCSVALGAAAVLALPAPPVSADAQRPSTAPARDVFIVQGVPATDVAVIVDGKPLDDAVKSKTVLGPLSLEPGSHDVDFTGDNWAVSSTFEVASASTDVVLHWPADVTDEPEVTVFTNNVGPIVADKGRLTFAHTAVVPPADVRVNDDVLFANIANGEFVSSEVAADTYSINLVPTGQGGPPLFGPVDLPVKAGTLTRVFAIGEPRNGSMDAVVQTLPLARDGSPAPDKVDAGSVGLLATGARPATQPVSADPPANPITGGGLPALSWTLAFTSALLAVAMLTRLLRRRTSS